MKVLTAQKKYEDICDKCNKKIENVLNEK